ncbi:FAD-dependent oxidoreductase [Zobellia galactanivorans]|uniref:Cyclic nucleotide dependent thioredoxin reductase n=1 Tax=Zobellia galactanivorans (strain DSM 12802 / CCUG 47099 / CIP 106680 / NCIMB 13871 / Dsij) TaxID=63186 RepID=G0L3W0_ZOBGA|nr:FAD-dependent oxidoreductase [Zobellia galactanivorans]CAZ95517.1 Cyclic nucleotide dependent thioredoxin reductase [Zobellia galactanivorans]
MNDPRFPQLPQSHVNILKGYGNIEHYNEETVVFDLGQLRYDFFVVLEGEIAILNPNNEKKVIVVHGKNEFSGDSGMLSDRGAQFRAVAKAGSELLKVSPYKLKEAIAKHSNLSDLLLNAFLQRQDTILNEYVGGIKLVGSGNSKEAYAIRDFMDKNYIWYNFLDVDQTSEANDLLKNFDLSEKDLPLMICNGGQLHMKPSLDEVARFSGVLMDFEDKIFDLLVIGAGPSGLAASVYAASEGLSVVTIDSNAPGGQAGKSSKIENYLGFPTGISGRDLANRAYVQAQKFGCNISIPHRAEKIEHTGNHFVLSATNGKVIKAKSLMAATGANYRQLPIDAIQKYEGSGVYYSATGMNASACKSELVGVVGGGNSAGQAALFLADYAKEVHVVLRGGDLGAKMSDYLVQRIEAAPNIYVQLNAQVTELKGDHHLESLVLRKKDGQETEMNITNLFTFIGAKPCTEWLEGIVATDEKGFVCTGPGINEEDLYMCDIYSQRKPQSLETSIPGFFAVGDVRKGSVKRVASAVGEGSMAVSQVHRFLADLRARESAGVKAWSIK